jgi:hypothetical protein
MNTVNASTGFSGFQLHLSRSPRVLPPIVPNTVPIELQDAADNADKLIQQLKDDVVEARDNLLLTKITQAHYADTTRGPDPHYKEGDLVMLLTTNWRHKYKKKGEKCSAKFLPRWDSPYLVIEAHPEASTYTLDIKTNAFPIYHASQLKPHHPNDNALFPSHRLTQPGPILTSNGLEEYTVQEIIDS